jgi:hypothetical protein
MKNMKKKSELSSLILLGILSVIIFGLIKQKELFYIAIIQTGFCTALRAFLNDIKNNN